jgi:hypothetical protein
VKRTLLIQAVAVTVLGTAALLTSPPAAAAAADIPHCSYCGDGCPTDLNTLCVGSCRGADAGSCSYGETCEGIDGHYYPYDIECYGNP